MRKILLLAPFDLFPPVHGGSAVVHNFVKYISRNNLMYVLLSHLYSRKGQNDLPNQNINIYYCPGTLFDRFKVLSFLFNPYYYKSAYKLMKNYNCDVIQSELLWTAFTGIFLKIRFNKPLILVEHNVEYLKFKNQGKSIYFTYILRFIEKFACWLSDKIVVFSKIDKEHLIDLYDVQENKIEIISPYMDLDIFKYDTRGAEVVRAKYKVDSGIILTFVGNLEYIPNITAVKYISERIYPCIIENYPDTKFVIIGQSYEHVLKYKRENIIFTGYLDRSSLLHHLLASDIVIVPIDSGSGVRIKILEAAACSKPIVSTKKGAEGLNFIDNTEIVLTDDVDEKFVTGIIRLIEDKGLRRMIGENARKKIEKEYNWEKEVKKFEKVYNEIA